MSLRKKLYYPCRFINTSAPQSLFASGGPLSFLSGLTGGVIRFVGGTGPDNSIGEVNQFDGATGDRYGGVMDPNLFDGVANPALSLKDPSGKRAASQAISAHFQCGRMSVAQPGVPGDFCVDFVAPVPNATPLNFGLLNTLPTIDPTTVRRPWLRIQGNPFFPAGATVEGIVYISRQHSIEV